MIEIFNQHIRDDNISFKEDNHEYTIKGVNIRPISVTTLIHKYFPEFDADAVITKMMSSANWPKSKYFGMTREVIKTKWETDGQQASSMGTIMHKEIEFFVNAEIRRCKQNISPVFMTKPIGYNFILCMKTVNILPPEIISLIVKTYWDIQEQTIARVTKEIDMFFNFWTNLGSQYPTLKPFRSEWLVYDEDIKLAGSIDCVLADNAGNIVILDWKRSKEIKESNRFQRGKAPFNNYDDCNLNHYRLQLNFYRHMLETKYNKKVLFMMLVILHPNQPSYKCYPVDKIELSHIWHKLNVF